MKTLKLLKYLRHNGLITQQQFRTFRGQVLSGNEDGCLRGLKRMKLI